MMLPADFFVGLVLGVALTLALRAIRRQMRTRRLARLKRDAFYRWEQKLDRLQRDRAHMRLRYGDDRDTARAAQDAERVDPLRAGESAWDDTDDRRAA